MNLEISNYIFLYFSFSNIGPMADLMSQSYLDKNSCYNSQVYGQNYSSHCYYGNMEYLSSGVSHSSLNVPSVSSSIFQYIYIYTLSSCITRGPLFTCDFGNICFKFSSQ